MAYYKITNITGLLNKRHPRFNTNQTVEFKDQIFTNKVELVPGMEIFVDCRYLPVSAQKLRNEHFISIIEIDKETYQKRAFEQEKNINAAQIIQTEAPKSDAEKESEPKNENKNKKTDFRKNK